MERDRAKTNIQEKACHKLKSSGRNSYDNLNTYEIGLNPFFSKNWCAE